MHTLVAVIPDPRAARSLRFSPFRWNGRRISSVKHTHARGHCQTLRLFGPLPRSGSPASFAPAKLPQRQATWPRPRKRSHAACLYAARRAPSRDFKLRGFTYNATNEGLTTSDKQCAYVHLVRRGGHLTTHNFNEILHWMSKWAAPPLSDVVRPLIEANKGRFCLR